MKYGNCNIFKMFALILLGLMALNCNDKINSGPKSSKIYPNFLKNTSWVIANDRLIGIEPRDSVYQLSLKSDTAQLWNFSAIQFVDDKKFTSYNSWECGNDCFTATFGTYEFIGINEIKLATDSITTSGTCGAPTKIFKNKLEEQFTLIKNEDKISLRRMN